VKKGQQLTLDLGFTEALIQMIPRHPTRLSSLLSRAVGRPTVVRLGVIAN
jgi:hypothetical protein